MKDQTILILDFHTGGDLGGGLCDTLTGSNVEGVELRHRRALFNDTASGARAPYLAPVGGSIPGLAFLVLTQEQLGGAGRVFAACKREWPETPLILVAEAAEPREIFDLFEHGAADYIMPPLKAVEILPRIWRLLKHERQSRTLPHVLKEKLGLRQFVGESPAFLSEVKKIPSVAKCDASILITGETGTGKELCARAIHYLSPRAGRPFVPVNCGAIPLDLVENELFGHERGAFTGAITAQDGLIRVAEGGTLFLDEVDCMPPLAQVKLLRFLQEKEYRPLGSAKTLKADVRIIAATNNDCELAVKAGKLRQDLYYRLNIVPLRLPTLRERRGDIPLLADHFLDKYAAQFGRSGLSFDSEATAVLALHDWPGNVRELENVIARSVALCEQGPITPQHFCMPQAVAEVSAPPASFREAKASFVAQFERAYIQKLLLAHCGNITRAAQAARKNRRAFLQLIRKYHINVKSLVPSSSPE